MRDGDIFYGNDDHTEMNDCMYKEDVIESMSREREFKDLKRKRRHTSRCNSFFLSCLEFFTLLREEREDLQIHCLQIRVSMSETWRKKNKLGQYAEYKEYFGDVLYGNDDDAGMDDYDYVFTEDVIVLMRREREYKELRRREKWRSTSYFGQCFHFFSLLRAFFKF
ncbi:unnamed protein product [Sphenostylis stenocarpa]|uniref:Uncharacterized protein n=1 Tax=Sphenostylis stenocarpa TaxID=92480 RepID=A0AA86VFP8_9FABA|nr:unnamed protein product [Sphenostylis stenocarpa]